MFTLQDGREYLFQWDVNRKVIVEDTTIAEVHFCNKTDDCSLVVKTYTEDGNLCADIPNILLQSDFPIRVYAYCADGYTKIEEVIKVKSRTKPSDYVYEETTVARVDVLIDRAEESIIKSEQAAENATITATELYEYVEGHKLTLTDDGEGNVVLEAVQTGGEGTDYATEEYVNNAIAAIPAPDLTGYATEAYVAQAIAGSAHPEPDLSNYYTKEEVNALFDGIATAEGGSY